jgi:hypothetical protein
MTAEQLAAAAAPTPTKAPSALSSSSSSSSSLPPTSASSMTRTATSIVAATPPRHPQPTPTPTAGGNSNGNAVTAAPVTMQVVGANGAIVSQQQLPGSVSVVAAPSPRAARARFSPAQALSMTPSKMLASPRVAAANVSAPLVPALVAAQQQQQLQMQQQIQQQMQVVPSSSIMNMMAAPAPQSQPQPQALPSVMIVPGETPGVASAAPVVHQPMPQLQSATPKTIHVNTGLISMFVPPVPTTPSASSSSSSSFHPISSPHQPYRIDVHHQQQQLPPMQMQAPTTPLSHRSAAMSLGQHYSDDIMNSARKKLDSDSAQVAASLVRLLFHIIPSSVPIVVSFIELACPLIDAFVLMSSSSFHMCASVSSRSSPSRASPRRPCTTSSRR